MEPYDAERINGCASPSTSSSPAGRATWRPSLYYALQDLPLDNLDLVVVGNVGSGSARRVRHRRACQVAVLSVTEGEEKPLKYPLLFRECKAVVLTKIDLLPHVPFDMSACCEYIHQVNAAIPVFKVSSLTGAGLSDWCSWVAKFQR